MPTTTETDPMIGGRTIEERQLLADVADAIEQRYERWNQNTSIDWRTEMADGSLRGLDEVVVHHDSRPDTVLESCGSAMCIGGWILVHGGAQPGDRTTLSGDTDENTLSAKDLVGFTDDEAQAVFYNDSGVWIGTVDNDDVWADTPTQETARAVAVRLREIADGAPVFLDVPEVG